MSRDTDRVALDTDDVWPEDTEADEGVVVNWFASEGGRVDAGDDICEFQIEKVSVDVPAPATGVLEEIALEENDEFERGDVLGWIRPA